MTLASSFTKCYHPFPLFCHMHPIFATVFHFFATCTPFLPPCFTFLPHAPPFCHCYSAPLAFIPPGDDQIEFDCPVLVNVYRQRLRIGLVEIGRVKFQVTDHHVGSCYTTYLCHLSITAGVKTFLKVQQACFMHYSLSNSYGYKYFLIFFCFWGVGY